MYRRGAHPTCTAALPRHKLAAGRRGRTNWRPTAQRDRRFAPLRTLARLQSLILPILCCSGSGESAVHISGCRGTVQTCLSSARRRQIHLFSRSGSDISERSAFASAY